MGRARARTQGAFAPAAGNAFLPGGAADRGARASRSRHPSETGCGGVVTRADLAGVQAAALDVGSAHDDRDNGAVSGVAGTARCARCARPRDVCRVVCRRPSGADAVDTTVCAAARRQRPSSREYVRRAPTPADRTPHGAADLTGGMAARPESGDRVFRLFWRGTTGALRLRLQLLVVAVWSAKVSSPSFLVCGEEGLARGAVGVTHTVLERVELYLPPYKEHM